MSHKVKVSPNDYPKSLKKNQHHNNSNFEISNTNISQLNLVADDHFDNYS